MNNTIQASPHSSEESSIPNKTIKLLTRYKISSKHVRACVKLEFSSLSGEIATHEPPERTPITHGLIVKECRIPPAPKFPTNPRLHWGVGKVPKFHAFQFIAVLDDRIGIAPLSDKTRETLQSAVYAFFGTHWKIAKMITGRSRKTTVRTQRHQVRNSREIGSGLRGGRMRMW
ncbi:hypothetical protein MQ089_10475 [Edwardsiella anguillarum]|uniref:hypothetical protein n=1 Tax=Edwardsiella anguillarum TaxID=1821960 RepID=UPI0024B74F1B|nr:hypothetical protein [Edwardsiella anguillarum]WHP78946.1 hypothetical protein MQ090_10455 [Edwardsiella anguillarum]WHQ16352.1 hypothetical protein MQ085_10485 [Edwardsiella anguillarum]WHQ19885.1 hypothetical protein MQ089_10475 [Edwardsiella anguillarum]WHQ23408.1 hypothetical protein MQ094_10490 [Edwardsiella anguillarum]WHQ26981.1 hypothetical protein MQ093_10705 [Edwardsiella anguillarum]